MAITATIVDHGFNSTAATSFNTNSFTRNASRYYTVIVFQGEVAGLGAASITGYTPQINQTDTDRPYYRIDILGAMGDGVTGALTITMPSGDTVKCAWIVVEWQYMATSGTVVQSKDGENFGGQYPSVSMASFADAVNNACLWVSWGYRDNIAVPSTFTSLLSYNPGYGTINVGYVIGQVLTPTSPTMSTDDWMTFGQEIAAAGGGGGGGSTGVVRSPHMDGLSGGGVMRANPLSYHRTPVISLEAYRRERARRDREFMARVRGSAR